MRPDMLSIGLMSGTSMDGIDAALLKTDGSPQLIQALGHLSFSYPPHFKMLLKATEYAIQKGHGDMSFVRENYQQAVQGYLQEELKLTATERDLIIKEILGDMTLDQVISHSTVFHAQVVKNLLDRTGYTAHQIEVVGYHGQTMFHAPLQKRSIIIGNAQSLANQVGIKVVADFRSQDIAAGGQGAPFAPLYHLALAIKDQKLPVAVVNCGGIANITLINSPCEDDLLAFDTGPGNGLIDKLVRQRTHGKENMDTDGQYGQKGKVNVDVLQKLFEKSMVKEGKNYFSIKPPKALDINDMQLIPELEHLSLEDACATLETFTAESIVKSLDHVDIEIPNRWILAGGGWHNPVILNALQETLQKKNINALKILKADEAGWNNQAMEAQIFAYLAVRSLQNKPLSLPNTTGVSKPMSGGQVFRPMLSF